MHLLNKPVLTNIPTAELVETIISAVRHQTVDIMADNITQERANELQEYVNYLKDEIVSREEK